MVDLVERIDVLLFQENTSYCTLEYLQPEHQHHLLLSSADSEDLLESSSLSTTSSSSGSSVNSGISEIWREKIVEWSYQVIDHFDFSREVVSVAIHYLDRFLASKYVNKKTFQLAAMTSLFLAVKLYEPGRISMSSMIELSRGYFTVAQLKGTELELLRVLGWHVHPPTAYCFAKHFLFLMPYTSISMDARHDILELSRFLTELSVIDYYFVGKKASSVALAALVIAMDEIAEVSSQAKGDFASELRRVEGLNPASLEVLDCRERLRLLYAQGGYNRPETRTGTRDEAVSPVCVSYAFGAQYMGFSASPTEQSQPATNKVSNETIGISGLTTHTSAVDLGMRPS